MTDPHGDLVPSADVLFAENPEQRCPCVLLLDTSGSMTRQHGAESAITQLNEGLCAFRDAIRQDPVASKRLELAVITFGEQVTLQQDFTPVDYMDTPAFTAGGQTPMGRAMDCALETIENRKNMYKASGVSYYRPWVFLITDGSPTDPDWEAAVRRLHEAVDRKKLIFFVVGVEPVDWETLARVAHPKRAPVKLKDQRNAFMEMFQWLSRSIAVVSRSAEQDGQAKLESPAGWGMIETG